MLHELYVLGGTITLWKLKGIVSVISSDPSCKDDNYQLTTESLKDDL